VTIFTTSKTRSIPADEKRRERKTYALVVEDEGKYFKEILNSVKSKIGSDSAGDAIRSVRNTRGGKLLVTTGKSDADEDLEALSRVIQGASQTIYIV
jgi:hypothetical protein